MATVGDSSNKRYKKNNKKKGEGKSVAVKENNEPVSTTLADELEWCIRQLELGLLRPRVSSEQKRESEQIISKLKSSKTPLPRKRQLMRATFGDYRAKMKTQPLSTLPSAKSKTIRIESVSRTTSEQSGQFYRSSCGSKQKKSDESSVQQPSFKFDFQIGGISRHENPPHPLN